MRALRRLVGDDGSSEPAGRSDLRRFVLVAIVLALVIVLRKPQALLHAQFRAEDGNVFFWEQLTLGFWGALAKQYAGFPYVVHRMLGALAAFVPIAAVPLAYNAATIALTALAMATFAVRSFRHLVRSDHLRAAVCVALVSMPGGDELLATPTNLGWWLAIWLVLLSVMRPPRTSWGVALWCAGGVLAIWSTPLAPVAAPLWVLRAVVGAPRLTRGTVFAATMLVALVALMASTDSLGAGPPPTRWGVHHLGWALRTLPLLIASSLDWITLPAPACEWLERHGAFAIVAPAVIAAAAVAFAVRDLRLQGRVTCGLAVYLVVCSLYLIIAGRPVMGTLVRDELPGVHVSVFAVLGPRHRALAVFAVLLLVAVVIDQARRTAVRLATAVVAGLVLALVWVGQFRVAPSRDVHWQVWAARLEQKLATGSPEPLVIPSDPPAFEIRVDTTR
jgi:hypothetical protein